MYYADGRLRRGQRHRPQQEGGGAVRHPQRPGATEEERKKNTPARDGKGCWRYDAGCAQLDSKSHNSHQTKAKLLSPTAYKNRLKRYV